jgi:hypothetical protein
MPIRPFLDGEAFDPDTMAIMSEARPARVGHLD